MGLFNLSQDNRVLVGLSNVFIALDKAIGKRWDVRWKDAQQPSNLREYEIFERSAAASAVTAIPDEPAKLVQNCLHFVNALKDREFSAIASLADAKTKEAKARHERDEALKRVKALEFELDQARESLRDKLAACALQPLLEAVPEANPYVQALTDGLGAAVAEEAYRVADAMLAQRAGIIDVEVKP